MLNSVPDILQLFISLLARWNENKIKFSKFLSDTLTLAEMEIKKNPEWTKQMGSKLAGIYFLNR